jgi:putative lipoprotein
MGSFWRIGGLTGGVVGLLLSLATAASAEALITGTASYREPIELPPAAVFEATLEDISRAGAAAVVITRTTIDNPGAPPIAFHLAYDPATIDPRLTYAVRSRIRVGERLLFTSDTIHPVLTRGAPDTVTVMMRMVGEPFAP